MDEYTEPRIWVGCLHCYNDGRLTGEWFDVNVTDEDSVTLEAVHAHGKLTPMCEELWVMDHEGFDGLVDGEGNVSEFFEAGDKRRELRDNSVDMEAWRAVADHEGVSPLELKLDLFTEIYRGCYSSGEDFAEEICTEVYDLDSILPEALRYRIDWEGVWRDMRLNGDFWELEVGWQRVHIFDGRY